MTQQQIKHYKNQFFMIRQILSQTFHICTMSCEVQMNCKREARDTCIKDILILAVWDDRCWADFKKVNGSCNGVDVFTNKIC